MIDGAIVALNENGRPSFNLLQRLRQRSASIVMYAFDLLMLRGNDVRLWPLETRREQLHKIVRHLGLSPHFRWRAPWCWSCQKVDNLREKAWNEQSTPRADELELTLKKVGPLLAV